MPDDPIADDEILLRRIPPGIPWMEPPERVTSANFKLSKDEGGLSVYRESKISVGDLLRQPKAKPDSLVLKATAREIRQAVNGKGECLGLDVIPVDDHDNPGHCEIRGNFSSEVSKALQRLFLRRGISR